jgi:creatinine amidohydrolase/Fe(II)-dependent formamide hydrolase-like protein
MEAQIGEKWIFPGSYTVRAETIRSVLMDLASDLGEQGFKWIFLVTLHAAPNHHNALDQASEYFREQYGGSMVNLFGLMPGFEARAALELPAAEAAEDGFAVHAGLRETADVLFHRPDLVAPSYQSARSITGHDMAELGRLAHQGDWPGYFGAPRLASASFGGRAWRKFADSALATAAAILDGADYRRMPRYSEVERLADQQRRWLQRKGLQ